MLRTKVYDSPDWASELESAWRGLVGVAESATPFQTWEWQSTWWKHYAKTRRPHVLAVYEGSDLVGLMPLMVSRGPWRTLRAMASGASDYLHPLARTGFEEVVADLVSQHFLELEGIDLVDLHQLRETEVLAGGGGQGKGERLKGNGDLRLGTEELGTRNEIGIGEMRGEFGEFEAVGCSESVGARAPFPGSPELTDPSHRGKDVEGLEAPMGGDLGTCNQASEGSERQDGGAIVPGLPLGPPLAANACSGLVGTRAPFPGSPELTDPSHRGKDVEGLEAPTGVRRDVEGLEAPMGVRRDGEGLEDPTGVRGFSQPLEGQGSLNGESLSSGRWPGPSSRVLHQATCLVLDLPSSFDTYLSTLNKSLRYDVRKLDKELFTSGRARIEEVGLEGLDVGLSSFFETHRRRWRKRGLPGAFVGSRSERFHREWAELACRNGWLWLSLLHFEGKTVGSIYAMRLGNTCYYYQAGFDPEASSISPGSLLVGYTIRRAISEGLTTFDFLRGDEPYKRRWKPQHEYRNLRIIMPANRLLGRIGQAWNDAGNRVEAKVRARLEGGGLFR